MKVPMEAAPLWSFAVISDTHVEADPDALANRRLEDVIDALQRHRPDFVIHLGDVIHPLPSREADGKARRYAEQSMSALTCPIHFTPGNHDIGDKPLQGMPAAPVTAEWRQRWIGRHGCDFTWFDHKDWRVVLVNSPVMNRDEATDAELADFLAGLRDRADRKPILLATHYPLFLESPSEAGHYDNIDPPARNRLLDFCRQADVRAVFSGHIHSYLYRELDGTRFHGAPAVSFVRRDFSEMADVAPFADFGRENPSKTGFLWVDVHAAHPGVRMIGTDDVSAFRESGLVPGATLPGEKLPLGVSLRHDWARDMDLPFNPPVAAFARRRYRDDDTLRAIVELGLRDLRIPLTDLLDEGRRRRLEELRSLGCRFCAFHQGPLSEALLAVLAEDGRNLDAMEVICSPDDLGASLERLGGLRGNHAFAIWFSPLSAPDNQDPRTKFKVRVGLDDPGTPGMADKIAALKGLGGRTGLVFSCAMSEFGGDYAARAARLAGSEDIEIAVLLDRLAPDTVALDDDADYPRQVARILSLAHEHRRLRIFLDTLMEFDRGYHARFGLIDRRRTPTPAGRVLREARMTRREWPRR